MGSHGKRVYKMETQEITLQEIAELENLRYVETTSESNGYPRNIRGAIVGFDNWQQLEKLAKKYNLNAISLHKRDGWQLYHRENNAYEPFKNSCDDYGDNYSQEDDAESYQKRVIEDELPYAGFSTFEEMQEWLNEKKEVYEELLSCGEDEIVITSQGRYYETIETVSMSFSHDTHNYIIGLQENE